MKKEKEREGRGKGGESRKKGRDERRGGERVEEREQGPKRRVKEWRWKETREERRGKIS